MEGEFCCHVRDSFMPAHRATTPPPFSFPLLLEMALPGVNHFMCRRGKSHSLAPSQIHRKRCRHRRFVG
uniref:Uncharacterized protein n=1 Tax=Physcomitrium patens TaxID=3218 RepID=A0A2K1IYN0_PHYPA|nr:hypothetical protein PHYPA_024188 [Physcomitrium patens]